MANKCGAAFSQNTKKAAGGADLGAVLAVTAWAGLASLSPFCEAV